MFSFEISNKAIKQVALSTLFFLEEYCFSDSGPIFLIFWRFEAENIFRIQVNGISLSAWRCLPESSDDGVYTLCNIMVHVLYNVSC